MRSPASYERGTTDEAAWRAVTTSADATLAGIAHGYTELREWSYRPVERSEVASVEPVLIIELDDPLLVADVADHASPRMWQAFGAGISQGPTSTLHSGTQHCVEVRLTPLGLYRMSGVAMDEVSNRVVSLEDLFGQNGRYLPERLAAEPDWTRRFDLLDSMFMRAVADGPEPDVEVEFAWDWLNRTGGTAIIGEILAEIGWSRARLARRFRSQVGLTPKAAARVLRFRRAMTLSAPGHRSLSSIALACSYFDQAHFNRDFRMLAGCSPREWAGLRHDDLLGCGIPMAGEHLYKTGADGGPSVGAIR
ncbi:MULTISPECIES: AraC family transcriptional regulator [Mycobacteroides]|uniref:AraC family transcriptional regulator n=1 Tax=Mycobacteroides chelonae TaxID=1774 RepID=A0A1S1LPH0_MYCCH|nr:helix-turn-helix domain-containing protein [Mycobacteroides chelonae]KRQ18369.1 AraC family transcriptional regulator [Mycobacteroides sp. H003]KRQ29253.1 AraC family transcriptional regulator [Mycobacteroides sp. H092]KRQ42090.1 AraC family transcriptional regulator [Mycobacteroides sp. H101]KRQ50096.1 AraC family transcriptional regulator [Mycobacteroides sp. H063]KRQ56327.1 AraC family transcriptional regulator [Mycobacteroides sp. HXVII]KRQ64466.1 AraC family transcriptional regulator 